MNALLNLRQLVDALGEHALMSVTDLAGTIIFANDRFCAVSGYAHDVLIGQNHRILKSGIHPPAFYGELWRALRAGETWHGLICNRRRDGTLYWVQSTIKPLQDGDGHTTRYLSIRTEVTWQVKLRACLEALALADGTSPYHDICRALGEMSGAACARIVRRAAASDTFEIIGDWHARPAASGVLLSSVASPLAATLDWRNESVHVISDVHRAFPHFEPARADDTQDYHGIPLRGRNGRGLGVLFLLFAHGVRRQETEEALVRTGAAKAAAALERAEASCLLEESEARLRTLVNNAPIGVFMAGLDGGLSFISKQIVTRYGRPAEQLLGEGWLNLLTPADRPRITAQWRTFVRDRGPRFLSEYHVQGPDGQHETLRTQATPIVENDRMMGFVGTVENVSTLRELEYRVRQAHKMEALGAFTGGIAHDFNNILASILGYAGLARGRLPELPTATLSTYLGHIEAAGNRGRSLVEHLLTFSRSTPQADIRAIEPRAVISESTQLLRAIVPASIQLSVEIEETALAIAMDPTELQQALFNLVINARDACGVHGTIKLAVARRTYPALVCSSCASVFAGTFVEISCSDTGSGIDPGVLGKIFEPFFTTKRDAGGTGLGLAVIHGVVHKGGGHIVADSISPCGTRFRLLLPVAEAVHDDRENVQESIAVTARRLLVLDDEPVIVELLIDVLEGYGHTVSAFSDPRRALQVLQDDAGQYDVLISDMSMPDLTGEEVCAALRSSGCRIPAILCSGSPDPLSAARREELAISAVLRKPMEIAALLAAIEAATAHIAESPPRPPGS